MNAATFGITLFTILRLVLGQDENCPLSLWVFPALDTCRNGIEPVGIGTLYADGKCHTLDRDSSSNSTQSLFPGNYIAECTSDGNIRFLSSGCLSDTCSTSSLIEGATCDSDSSSTASLYSISAFSNGWPVQDPGLAFLGSDYTCYEFQDDAKSRYVSLVVFGDCSRNAGCQVEGQAVPTASTTKPSTATPVAAPAPVQVPVSQPSPIESPTTTNNTNTTTNSFAPSASPSRFPVPVPTSVPSKQPSMAQIPVSQNNTNTSDDDEILPPFRNSTTQGTASIMANQTLELPPPAAGIKEIIETFPNNGGLKVNPSDGSITYTPNVNFIGTDTFTIQQCRNLPVDSSDVEEDCESLTVAVEVTPLSLTPDADGNDENGTETSSSSSGLYGLAALAIIPIVFLMYVYHRRNSDSNIQKTAESSNMRADGNTVLSNVNAPSNVQSEQHEIEFGETQPPQSHLSQYHHMSTSSESNNPNYLPSNKDQVRSVVGNVSDINATYNNQSIQTQSRNYLPTNKDQVRSVILDSSGMNTSNTSNITNHPFDRPTSYATTATIEPEARAIPQDDYQVQLKDQCRDVAPSNTIGAVPVLVDAILISHDEDISEYSTSGATNRLDTKFSESNDRQEW